MTVAHDAARLERHPVFDRPHAGACAVVVCHFNPCDYQSTRRNLLRVLDHLDSTGVPVFAAELRCGATSELPPVLPVHHPRVLQLTSSSVLWRKENLWNLVARNLPDRYKHVLCLDADVILPSQLPEAINEALAVTRVAHPFTRAIWLDPCDGVYNERPSFGLAIAHGREDRADKQKHFLGFGIAIRRDFWDVCGGLYNCPIGTGDWMFVAALCGRAEDLKPPLLQISRRYWDDYAAWADRVHRWCDGSIGYVDGDAFHLWHGRFRNRQYDSRNARLQGFDPYTDLAANASSGVVEWTPSAYTAKPDLVYAVESYFGARLEDDALEPRHLAPSSGTRA